MSKSWRRDSKNDHWRKAKQQKSQKKFKPSKSQFDDKKYNPPDYDTVDSFP